MIGAVNANAATSGATATSTNTNPEAAMTALFGDPAVAKGKGFEIKRSDLDQVLSGAKANAAAQGQQLPPEFQAQILNQLIYIQLLLQKANDSDKAEGKKDADEQFALLQKHFGSQEAFDRQLKAVGMTMDQLKNKATQEATAKAALRRELNITISDADAKAYYDSHPGDFERPEMVRVQHILLMTMDPATRQPLGAAQQQAKRKQIDDLLKRARAGEDFTALVKQYSEDPGSKDAGGEYTFARASADPSHAMVPEFEAAAFSMQTNQISDVVTTQYGYHIIKLLEKIPAKKEQLTDKIGQSSVTVQQNIKDFLTQKKIRQLAPAYVEKIKKESHVEIVDANLKALSDSLEAQATNAPAAAPEQ